MSITIQNRKYKKLINNEESTFLLAAKDDLISYEFEASVNYGVSSSLSLPIEVVSSSFIRLIGGNWSDYGFVIGDLITFTFTPDGGAEQVINATILNIIGDQLAHNAPAAMVPYISELFPGGGNSTFAVTFQSIQDVEVFEALFNLIPNSASGGASSLIDGEVNRLRFNVTGLAIAATVNGIQLGDKSGGYIYNSTAQRLADIGSVKNYKIVIQFYNWLSFEESDLSIPPYYVANETIKTFTNLKALRQATNPNSSLSTDLVTSLGNVGWYNQNYNQGLNPFVVESLILTNDAGDVIQAVDFANPTNVSLKVTGTGTFQNGFSVVMYHIPFDDRYKNTLESFADNVFLTYISNYTVFSKGLNGGTFAVSSVVTDFTISDEATISFKLTPNAAATAYFDALPAGDLNYRLSATLQTTAGTATNNNRTTLLLQEKEFEKAAILGVEAKEVESLRFLIHPQPATDLGSVTLEAYTEDDLLIKSLLKLEKSKDYERINLSFRVVKDATGEFFNLFSRSIGLEQYPLTPDNKRLINYVEQLVYNLPNPERNVLSVKFNNVQDSTTYDIDIRHTLLLSWRYWQVNPNALADFLDITLPNNGVNNEWVRYAQTGFSFVFRIGLVTDGVEDFVNAPITIRDYDDSVITSTLSLEDTSGNSIPGILNDQDVRVKALHESPSAYDQANTWGWIRTRPRENEPSVLISTVWGWNSANSPLKPITGDTEATLTFPAIDDALIQCLISGSQINDNQTLVTRIGDPLIPVCSSPMEYFFNYIRLNYKEDKVRLEAMNTLLDREVVLPKPNGLCCPLCEITVTEGGAISFQYIFGGEKIITPYKVGKTGWCCTNVFPLQDPDENCDANYISTIDTFITPFTAGEITIIEAEKPTESNPYFSATIHILTDEINATFVGDDYKYLAFKSLLDKGFKIECNDTDMIISNII